MCYMNFPRCDETGTTLNLCTSVCQNFFKSCDYPPEYWRCGEVAYYGYDAPEVALNVKPSNGAPIYVRSWWPGLPFTPNKVGGGAAAPVCTPGSANGAAAAAPGAVALLAVLAAAAAAAAYW